MAGTQPHYHISRLKRPRHHKHSLGGLQLETKHRKTGHSTIHGAEFRHVHKHLHALHPPHLEHKHGHHPTPTAHHHVHTLHEGHTSAVQHQHRVSEHKVELHSNRHEAAMKAIETKKAKGEKIGFAALTPAQRHANAIRSAATRKARHIPTFGGHPHRGSSHK